MHERPLRDRLGTPTLPDTYGVDRVVGIPVSADTLAWHWELSGTARAQIDGRDGGHLRLRCLPSMAGTGVIDLGEQRGQHGHGRTQVTPGKSYLLRLVWVAHGGSERTVAESAVVKIPWDRPDSPPDDAVRQSAASLRPVDVGPRGEPPWGGS